MNNSWSQFSRETFGEPVMVWHDGIDYELLLKRWLDNRDLVRRVLQIGITDGDPVAAQAITFLARRGEPLSDLTEILASALRTSTGTLRVRLAEALFAVTSDQQFAEPICEVLVNGSFWGERLDAAIALSAFRPTERVVDALGRGVQDEEYLVRRHSAQSLLTLAGRATTIENEPDEWTLIRADNDIGSWRRAAIQLQGAWTT